MRRFIFAILFTALPSAALAATVSPSTILANPSSYDGKMVTATGTVSHFQTSSTMMGKVAGFELCDVKCVVVIDEKDQPRSNGASATVTGTFHVSFKGPRKSFNNAIVIGR